MRALLMIVLCSVTLAAQTAGAAGDIAGSARRPQGSDAVADLLAATTAATRHSPLTQITPENVNQLTAQWTFQTGTLGSFQTTPIVIDGVHLRHRLQQQRLGDRCALRAARSGAIAASSPRTCSSAAAPSTAASACSAIGCT